VSHPERINFTSANIDAVSYLVCDGWPYFAQLNVEGGWDIYVGSAWADCNVALEDSVLLWEGATMVGARQFMIDKVQDPAD
jgi:hypothetical protein